MSTLPEREIRTSLSSFEIRSADDGTGPVMVGYAAKFNTRSQDLGGFVETIAPGTFSRAIEEAHDVRALINHDPNLVIGRTVAGTLRLIQDEIGLRYEVDLPDTSAGRDLSESLRRGDISQSSFGFRVLDADWSLDTDGRDLRTIRDLALFDVSPVTYPAYLDTDSGLAQRDLEKARVRRLANSRGYGSRIREIQHSMDAARLEILSLTVKGNS
ncbi:HK97 family phage prohead protease [Kitasatospora sp. MBT66]|uniref:HK97 family phage prohead protease n=1 Tax=Kitasatospora sp. MBT66 TaxID=1444769 RepID=UPI0005BAAF7B|nr:HK97 family phage prohead protease [Kitasatospora sp. MBT66]